MNNRALTLSLVMAVIAVFFVSSYVTSIEEEAKKKFGTEVLVIKAKKDIKEMETLTENVIELERVPKRFLEPSAVYFEKKEADQDTSAGLRALAGRIAIVPIKKGEQISGNKVSDPGMRTGLSPQVAPGRRAISVPISEVTGLSKLVKPGDRIDLIAVIDTDGKKENRIAKTILQDVVVLSTGRNVTSNIARSVEPDPFNGKDRIKNLTEDPNFNTVTLEVEPLQVQMLALILNNGDNALTLSLRNNDDSERVQTPVTNVRDVLGSDLQRLPSAAPQLGGGIRR